MYSTGCPSSSGSYSVLVPWSGGVSWVLLRPTPEIFAIPPRAPEVAVHSDHQNRGYSLFLLLVHPQPRPVHSWWLVPLCGMGFRCRKDCSPGFFLTLSTLVSKLFFLAVQGSGALLSSNLEGRYINLRSTVWVDYKISNRFKTSFNNWQLVSQKSCIK